MQLDANSLIGILVSTLLTILIFQVRTNSKKTNEVSIKLDSHIVEMLKIMGAKMDTDGCKNAREECFSRIRNYLIDPLVAGLNTQRDDYQKLWVALRSHTHTGIPDEKDKVIVPHPFVQL